MTFSKVYLKNHQNHKKQSVSLKMVLNYPVIVTSDLINFQMFSMILPAICNSDSISVALKNINIQYILYYFI
jgi:hypothetical protein